MVMSVPGLHLGLMSGFMALMQPWSVLMSQAPDVTEGWEEGAGCTDLALPLTGYSIRENPSCPLPAEALRGAGPTPHLGSTIGLTPFTGAKVSWL